MDAPWLIRRAHNGDAPALASSSVTVSPIPGVSPPFADTLRLSVVPGSSWPRSEGHSLATSSDRSLAGEAEILNLAVAPAARRNGVGAAILDGGPPRTRPKPGLRRSFSRSGKATSAAQSLYARRGFQQIGRRPAVLSAAGRGCHGPSLALSPARYRIHLNVDLVKTTVGPDAYTPASGPPSTLALRPPAVEVPVSKSLNKVTLIGNLGQDPEVRSIANGGRVANFSLATSRQWGGQGAEKAGEDRVAPDRRLEQYQGGGSGLPTSSRSTARRATGLRGRTHRVPHLAGQGRPDPVHHRDHRQRHHPALRGRREAGKCAASLRRAPPRGRGLPGQEDGQDGEGASTISRKRSTAKTTISRSDPGDAPATAIA